MPSATTSIIDRNYSAETASPVPLSPLATRRLAFHRFYLGLAIAIVGLIFLGGLVTSTESGLSVPDWPLSFGSLNPPGWIHMEHVRLEHGHRLYAATMGLFIVAGAFWARRVEPRAWVKALASLAVVTVICQGILGGITVRMKLPVSVSMAHAVLGQTLLALIVTLAVVTAPAWLNARPIVSADAVGTQRLATFAALVIYIQLMLGALMRHMYAGLAITDWPTSLGQIVPPLDNPMVAVHFAHRTWAYMVVLSVSLLAGRLMSRHRQMPVFATLGVLLFGLIGLQFALGVSIIWTLRAVFPTTLHVAMGAMTLVTTLITILLSYRFMARRQESRLV